jgi:hypothetical protein
MKRTGLILITTIMLFSLGCSWPKFMSSWFSVRKTNTDQNVDINNNKFDYRTVDKGLAGPAASPELLNSTENKQLKTEAEHIDDLTNQEQSFKINIP